MTKLNWRDASTALPNDLDDCIVLIGEKLEIYEDYYNGSEWYLFSNESVKYWIYRSELTLPPQKIKHDESNLIIGMKIDAECPLCNGSCTYHQVNNEYRCNEIIKDDKRKPSCGWFNNKLEVI